jgi:hypothetical protein
MPPDPSSIGRLRDRKLTSHTRAGSRLRPNVHLPPERREPVGDALEPGAVGHFVDFEAHTIVGRFESEPVVAIRETQSDAGCLCVLGDVLEGLEAGEVEGGFDLTRVSADAVTLDVDRNHRPPGLRIERGNQPLIGEQRRIDPPGEVAKLLERAAQSVCRVAAIDFAFSPSRSMSCSNKRSFTESATICCWAPSWRFRSSFRRSSSCAVTRRCRDARNCLMCSRNSSVSATFRITSPACAARLRTSRSSVGVTGSPSFFLTDNAPSSSPSWRMGSSIDVVAAEPSSIQEMGMVSAGSAASGHTASDRSFWPTRTHTSARVAPVPSTSARAILGSNSSLA